MLIDTVRSSRFNRSAAVADRTWLRFIEPLWVVGLALLCLLVGHAIFRSPWLDLQGKTYDWAQYAVAGVVFPMLIFGLPLLWRWQGWPTDTAAWVRQVLAFGCLVAFAAFLVASGVKYGPASVVVALALAVLQMLVMTRPWRQADVDPGHLALVFVVSFVGWTVALSLFLTALMQPPLFVIGFFLAFLLIGDAARDPGQEAHRVTIRRWTPANVAALIGIAFMSLRTEGLFQVLGERGAIHHWGAWVGAADLMREGGWLLWDAPSNYGSLNVLAFAVLPTTTPWQSFYLLQALAFFVVSGGIFLILRTIRPGLLNWCFALALAIAIPMFQPPVDPFEVDALAPVTATFIFPNWGAYRYVWAFVLVLILLWERFTEERSRRHAWVLLTGCLVWLVGVLWSPESAFFCTGAWLPAYVVMVIRTTAVGSSRWRRALGWLALPLLWLVATLGLIAFIFATRLGHLPDWRAYFDYAQEVGLNILVVPQAVPGPALAMLLGFCLLAIGAVYAAMRAGWPTRSFGLWVGLLGAYWAANSYGYQRGLTALHPVAYTALGLLLVFAMRLPWWRNWSTIARAGVVPLLVLVLTLPLAAIVANPFAIREAAASLAETAQHGFSVEYLLPDADPELQQLMAEAGVQADDPIFYAGDWLGNYLLPWRPGGATDGPRVIGGRHWTPGHPALALRWIPPGRGAVYTDRYLERHPMSGWLIQRKTGLGAAVDFNAFAGGLEPWFYDVAGKTHIPTRIYESQNWQLVWFEDVGDRADLVRPDFGWDRLGPLPPDTSVDGRPLNETVHPEVWTIYGTGWGLFDPALDGRGASQTTEVWIYSPDDRKMQLRLTPSYVSGGNQLAVSVDGGSGTRTLKLQAGSVARTSVKLHAGWNRMVLSLQDGRGDRESGIVATPTLDDSAPTGSEEAEPWRGFILQRLELVNQSSGKDD